MGIRGGGGCKMSTCDFSGVDQVICKRFRGGFTEAGSGVGVATDESDAIEPCKHAHGNLAVESVEVTGECEMECGGNE